MLLRNSPKDRLKLSKLDLQYSILKVIIIFISHSLTSGIRTIFRMELHGVGLFRSEKDL